VQNSVLLPGTRAATHLFVHAVSATLGVSFVSQQAISSRESALLLPATPRRTRHNHRSQRHSLVLEPRFAHPAERGIADWLTCNGVRWMYEPTSFPLSTGPNGELISCFTPDFYLPDDHVYIEMTTMRQSLVTRKNQKFRRMRESYPEIDVKLLYRRDVDLILNWYQSASPVPPLLDPTPRFTGQQIRERAKECAHQIAIEAKGTPVHLSWTTDGAHFACHILESLNPGIQITDQHNESNFTYKVHGIVGTALTARNAHIASDSRLITLLNRPTARLLNVPVWFSGFTVGSEWFLGAGIGGHEDPDIHVASPRQSIPS
jgi:hypoxanthine phosphoribosyltransferase